MDKLDDLIDVGRCWAASEVLNKELTDEWPWEDEILMQLLPDPFHLLKTPQILGERTLRGLEVEESPVEDAIGMLSALVHYRQQVEEMRYVAEPINIPKLPFVTRPIDNENWFQWQQQLHMP